MAAAPFETPSSQIPLVVMRAGSGSASLRVLLDTGNASPFAVILSEAICLALAVPTSEPPLVTAAVGKWDGKLHAGLSVGLSSRPYAFDRRRRAISGAIDLISSCLPGEIDAIVGRSFVAGES